MMSAFDQARPPGVALLFASKEAIAAAPAAEREAYYRIVEDICAEPAAFGFRRETAVDLDADSAADRSAGFNNDWVS